MQSVCVMIAYSRKHVAERFSHERLDVVPKCSYLEKADLYSHFNFGLL